MPNRPVSVVHIPDVCCYVFLQLFIFMDVFVGVIMTDVKFLMLSR